MTKDEFIDGYMARSKLDPALRTAEGFNSGHAAYPGRIAIPCSCDYGGCQGWVMIRDDPESLAEHARLHSLND